MGVCRNCPQNKTNQNAIKQPIGWESVGKCLPLVIKELKRKNMKINFIVKSNREGQPATVYLRYSDTRGIDFMTPTREKVFPEHWSNKTQTFKQRIMFDDLFTEKQKTEIEDRFTEIRAFINKEYFLLKGNPVSKDWVKSTLEKFYEKGIPGNETLNQYIKRFIDEATSGKRLAISGNAKKQYSWHSLRSMRGFMLSFNTFQGIENVGIRKLKGKKWPERPYKPLNFNDINIDFYNDFIEFFYEMNCSPNYIGKHIQVLKALMRQAREEGLHNNMEIERKAFRAISEEIDNIYLTAEELKMISKADLSDSTHLQEVRDVFLAGCYTAQRYSDYSKINKSNIRVIAGKKVIELIQEKTGEKCLIPIMPELEAILKKYDYTLPKSFQQKVNDGIKKIGLRAGIKEMIQVERNRGGLTVKTYVMKCDLIKTHTARRTGCSLMYLAGIPTIDIMKISGHKTPNEFLKYIRVSKEETAVALSNHPYFIGNPLSIAK
jgi:hypothetical protein